MDLLSVLTGSENLYKYLLIGGIGMLVLSLLYPIQKNYELACQKDLYAKEISLLNLDIDQLNEGVNVLSSESKVVEHSLDSIKTNKISNSQLVKALKDSWNSQYDSLVKSKLQLSKRQIDVAYTQKRIETLNNHISEFKMYEKIFFWAGIFCGIAGIIGWFLLMQKAPKS